MRSRQRPRRGEPLASSPQTRAVAGEPRNASLRCLHTDHCHPSCQSPAQTKGPHRHFWQGATAQMTLSKALAGRDADAGRDFGCREALAGRGVGARSLWRLGPWREGVLAPGGFGSRKGRGPTKWGGPPGANTPSAKHLPAKPFFRKKEPKKGRQKMPALINTTKELKLAELS